MTVRKPALSYPVTPEWRHAVRAELQKRPRGALTRLAEAIGASTGQVTELLSDESRFSTYVAKVNKYFGWTQPKPPLMSNDTHEIQYLIEGMGDAGRELLRALKEMDREEALAYVRVITLSARKRPSNE